MNMFDGLNVGEVTFEPGNVVYSVDLPADDPRKAILDDMSELLGCPVSLVDIESAGHDLGELIKVCDPPTGKGLDEIIKHRDHIDVMELAKKKAGDSENGR